MNYTTGEVRKQSRFIQQLADTRTKDEKTKLHKPPQIPDYLEDTYWWAYIRPGAVSFFERQWIINTILWGNYVKLRDTALNELGNPTRGHTLQIACVYGDFTVRLAQRIANGGLLDIVDVLPIQLDHLSEKLPSSVPARTILCDSTSLKFANDATYDQAVMFFLLHEMPAPVREKTLQEVLRVIKPGGKLLIIDYHKPSLWHPLRYLFPLIYKLLEPFALDTWNQSIEEWLPKDFVPTSITKETMFGGLYQKVVIRK